jgi:NAD(P)-dependent dehydrogenase (short-subunit alcohol dehydrogenase family)
MRLAGKLCVITGAARGIGAGIAKAFAAQGAQVIVTDIDDAAGAATAAAIGARYLHLDVASEAKWAQLAQDVPSLDVLVITLASPDLNMAAARMILNIQRSMSGGASTVSISMVHFWAVVMR